MSQKQSEASWDEVLAALDAAGPWPDGFLSESDLRPPQRREAMPLIRDENAPRPSRAVMDKAFEIAEASLRLEGMEPGSRYYALKERVLAGEITPEQAIAEMVREAKEEAEDMEIARRVMRANRETLRELAAQDAGRRLLDLAGSAPDIEDIPRRKVTRDDRAPDVELVRTPPEDGSRRRWKHRQDIRQQHAPEVGEHIQQEVQEANPLAAREPVAPPEDEDQQD